MLILSVLYAYKFGDEDKKAFVYCSRDFYGERGTNPSYSYIYNLMFLGCRLKNQSEESKNITSAFYNTGTGHLLSISGLHVGSIALFVYFLIGGLLYFVLGYFNKRHLPFFYISLPTGFLVSLFYVYSIGLEVPRLRSLLMLGMVFLAFFVSVFKNRMIVLCVACTTVLFMMPEALFSYSFYYSFIAVFALIFCKPKGVLGASFSISLFLIPLNLHSAGGFNLFHIFNNAIVIPVFSLFYFPIELVMTALIYFGLKWPVLVFDLLTQAFVWIIKMLSFVSSNFNLKLENINIFECLYLYSLLFCFIYAFKNFRDVTAKKCYFVYGTVLVFTVVFTVYFYSYSLRGDRILNFSLEKSKRSNGSGDFILGVIGENVFVVDTGSGGWLSSRVLKEISRRKIDSIDYLLLSHGDLDHFGGIEDLLKSKTVKRIIIPPFMLDSVLKLKPKSEVFVACKGSALRFNNGAIFKFYTPYCDNGFKKLELSFSVDSNAHFVLFLSDLKLNFAEMVIKDVYKSKGHLDVLQLSHHCSKNDNNVSFLNKIQPGLGFCNRHKSLLKSQIDLNHLSFPVISTGLCGDTELRLKKSGIFVSSEKCSNLSLRIP